MAKLTLNVDDDVVRRAKEFAEGRATSVSALVERFLDTLTRMPESEEDTPILRRLRGSLRGATIDVTWNTSRRSTSSGAPSCALRPERAPRRSP